MANELTAPGSLDRWCSPTFKSMEGRGGGGGGGEGGKVQGRSCTALRPIWTIKPGQIFGGGGGNSPGQVLLCLSLSSYQKSFFF